MIFPTNFVLQKLRLFYHSYIHKQMRKRKWSVEVQWATSFRAHFFLKWQNVFIAPNLIKKQSYLAITINIKIHLKIPSEPLGRQSHLQRNLSRLNVNFPLVSIYGNFTKLHQLMITDDSTGYLKNNRDSVRLN